MQIVEVKNNLVKISYDTSAQTLILSGFVVIKDSAQSFIGQIIHLEADTRGNGAIVKLLFNFDENGVISNYNGSIPDMQSALDVVHPQELLELLPVQTPILLGELAQQDTQLKLDIALLEQKLLVCSEREDDNVILTKNLASQLAQGGKKVLVFDFEGNIEFSANRIVAGQDFKLPLNYETINFIYEKGLDDAKAETKAMIQEIFLEVQNYVKTLEEKFIPFETFKTVVDEQYEETELVELVLLKNKLLKYYEEGIFAQEQSEFNSLEKAMQTNGVTVFDLSGIDEKVQREMVSYAYSLIGEAHSEIYVFCSVNNSNSDKKLLKQIFSTKQAYSTLICSYSYKYLKELKQLSKDLILFAPIQKQDDFAGYNTFLSKLNSSEFVVYGETTHHLPLIVKLLELEIEELENIAQEVQPQQVSLPSKEELLLDEEIKRDVDEIFIAPKSDVIVDEEFHSEELTNEDLTEDDLDFIDDLNTEDAVSESNDDGLFAAGSVAEIYEENLISEPEIHENVYFSNEVVEEDFEQREDEESVLDIPQSPFQEVYANQEKEKADENNARPALDILPVKMSSTPIVPIYSADVDSSKDSETFEQGDLVAHPKYGKGTVEKLITYGSKTLCSINFDNVGRRLLDPTLAEIKKV